MNFDFDYSAAPYEAPAALQPAAPFQQYDHQYQYHNQTASMPLYLPPPPQPQPHFSPPSAPLPVSSFSPPSSSSFTDLTSIFEDLYSRFFVNLPASELVSFERIMCQLEQAWWFYLDFYADREPALPRFNLKQFCAEFFQFSPLLSRHLQRLDSLFTAFQSYLASVPVCGVILLSPCREQVLLVKGYKGSWGFPKGKIDEKESEVSCAVREAAEEVGFDCSSLISPSEFIETNNSSGKSMKLFIVSNVPTDTIFQTQTRNEIAEIRWVRIADLVRYKQGDGDKKGAFWNVRPFVEPLRRWINKQNKTNTVKKSAKKTPKPAANNAATKSKAAPRSVDSVTFSDSSASGWSPEQMFEVNERLYGVKSSVPDEPLNAPENIEEILEKVLGKKGAHKKQSQTTNKIPPTSASASKPPRQRSKAPPSQPAPASASKARHSDVDDLDFGHNPHTVHALVNARAGQPASSASASAAHSAAPVASSSSSSGAFDLAAFAASLAPPPQS